MGQLKNLKALHLESMELFVVNLCNSDITELPNDMGRLINLRLLDMSGCKVSHPANCNVIASMPSLEGLYLFENFGDWAGYHNNRI